MSNASQAYLNANVNTAGQGELLLMLYDGAIKFLQQAKVKMLEKDYAKKGILISKTIDILNELSSSLNMEKGGSISENLNNLYFFCITYLLQANMKMDPTKIDSVIDILSNLRGAYAEIIETPEARRASEQIAARMAPSTNALQRNTFTGQAVNTSFAGQSHGRAIYGKHAQVSTQPQASVENNNIPANVQVESSPASYSTKTNVVNMNVSKPSREAQAVQINNAKSEEKCISFEQNNTNEIQTTSASSPSVEGQSGLAALSKRPLGGLGAKMNNRRMSLYGKVGQ